MEIKLDKWQQEVLDYEGDILLCTGRQVGKTTILAQKSGRLMAERPNTKIIVCSLTEDQAQLIIVMVLDYLERNYKKMIGKGRLKPTKNKVNLTNKSQILARPVGNTGDAVRGFTGDVLILDEMSRMPDFVFEAAKPTLMTTGGKLWFASTPFGKKGYFYECYQNKSNRFKVFSVTSEAVINEREISESWTEEQKKKAIEYLENEKKDFGEKRYAQEYLGQFVDDLRRLIPDELINKVCRLMREPDKAGTKYLGVDIARLGEDETTYEILTKLDGKCYHIDSIIKTKQLTTQTQQEIINLDKVYDFKQIGIDAGSGSLGVGIYDNLMLDSVVKRKLHAMNNRAIPLDREGKKKQRIFKEDLYDNFIAMMERGEIALLDDEKVKLSLQSIQYEYAIQNDQPTTLRIFGNYSHIVEGLIRAAWLAKQDKSLNLFISWV